MMMCRVRAMMMAVTMAVTMAMMKAMIMMMMKKKNGTAGQLGAVMVCISKTESPFSALTHTLALGCGIVVTLHVALCN